MQNSNYEQDYAIKELPQAIKDILESADLPWLNSLEFCTLYDPNPAERVWIKGDSGHIHQVVFYRVAHKMMLRIIDIVGFPNILDIDIQYLIQKHSAQLAVVNRLESSVKVDETWQPTKKNIYLHSYITIADLTGSKDEYLRLLGKKKRERYPNYWRRLNRHFNDAIDIRCVEAQDIDVEDIIQLEHLNKERRAGKGKGVDSAKDIQDRQYQRLPVTKSCGFLVTLRHNETILGGTLNYISGNEAHLAVIAHDPAYEHFNIGTISLWKTIECLIEKGVTKQNFLWGRQAYKTQFLGVEYPWSVHVISPYRGLAVLWKNYIKGNEFYIRVVRFAKTKLRIN